mmetsp:Transcript_13948/g.36194  ORF Transcript_13948/g.36194 Transcript_13948/m.36194 type:complete len:204 (+) Transcript_13948:422-1033(+)
MVNKAHGNVRLEEEEGDGVYERARRDACGRREAQRPRHHHGSERVADPVRCRRAAVCKHGTEAEDGFLGRWHLVEGERESHAHVLDLDEQKLARRHRVAQRVDEAQVAYEAHAHPREEDQRRLATHTFGRRRVRCGDRCLGAILPVLQPADAPAHEATGAERVRCVDAYRQVSDHVRHQWPVGAAELVESESARDKPLVEAVT